MRNARLVSGVVLVMAFVAARGLAGHTSVQWALVGVGIAAGVVWVVLSQSGERARSAAMASWAGALGWTFVPNRDPGHREEFPQFPVFSVAGVSFNTVRGAFKSGGREYTFKCGDWEATRSRHTRELSYLVVTLPVANTPGFEVRPKDLLDSVVAAIGLPGMAVGVEEFDREYLVSATDTRFAAAVLSGPMIGFLLAHPPPLPRVVTVNRAQVCITSAGVCWGLDEFNGAIGWMERFLALWPGSVFEGHPG